MGTPAESSTALSRALRPPSGPRSVIFDLGGPVVPAVGDLCERVRMLLAAGDVDLVTVEVGALASPDAIALDALARLQLTARRSGGSIRLRHAREKLRDLLALAGLSEQLPGSGDLFETQGKSEQREEARFDEEVDPTDPPV
ncbi:MAG TPA: STAS domain-containing protein [Acidimicrobiia bacterium]